MHTARLPTFENKKPEDLKGCYTGVSRGTILMASNGLKWRRDIKYRTPYSETIRVGNPDKAFQADWPLVPEGGRNWHV